MKTKYLILFILFTFSCITAFSQVNTVSQNTLSGKVIDAGDNTPLEGVSIFIPDLKIGAISGADGTYNLNNIPKGTYIVEARLIGYTVSEISVTISDNATQDFVLKSSAIQCQEIVVTGNAVGNNLQSTAQPITEVPNSYLQQNASTNVVDAIAKIPGVSAITDGQSISKPVIRGLGYNRLVTVNDGVLQEGQQWGDEFGIEIDPNSVDRVQILKGPASLVYGSDAISGVINFLAEKPLPEGQIKSDIAYNYQTNNGLTSTSGHVAGTNNGISWSGRITSIEAHAYQNKYDGYVTNSQFSNFNYEATVGIHRSWGFSQLHFSFFNLQTGIVDGTRDSATGILQKQIAVNGNPTYVNPTLQEQKSYTPFLINQNVKHSKLVWDNSVALGEGRITGTFAWQQNSRQENNDPTMPDVSNIWYFLNTMNGDIRYVSPEYKYFNFSVGTSSMYQNSTNKGTLLLIPEYNSLSLGGFAIGNEKFGKLTISEGVRYDTRQFKGHDSYIDSNETPVSANTPGALHRFVGYTSNFRGATGSAGLTYQFNDKFYIKANAASGFRAPNVAESGSNGIHDGTVVYEIGNPLLKPEQSMEFDIAPGIKTKDITFEVDVFSNSINNYIFPKVVLDSKGKVLLDSSTVGFGPAPVYKYTQNDAMLTGGEAMLDIHPSVLPWLDLYAAYSIVNAQLKNVPDSIKYPPFIPPARLQSAITFTAKKLGKNFANTYIRFGVTHVFAQKDIYLQSATYTALSTASTPFEYAASKAPTESYTLINAGIGSDIVKNGRKLFTIYISGDNLMDVGYMDYMSRFKYYPVNYSNGSYRVGVYNMGRNISFKIFIPLDFSK